MLRKQIFLLLAMVLALGCASAAAEDAQAYTHPRFGYSLAYPAGYVVLDRETIGQYDEGEFFGYAFSFVKHHIEAEDVVYIADTASDSHAVINRSETGGTMSAEELISLKAPEYVSSNELFLTACKVIDDGSVVTYGSNEYARLAFTFEQRGETVALEQFMIVLNGALYHISISLYGEPSAELLELLLGSLVVGI